ncbi:MAG TPA: response regulator transcription factor [Pseudomonadales bacterium]|nr:response regulator transcription factor [Pseudomonadales bacterium]
MPAPYRNTRILIVDDHPIYLDGISYWLQTVFTDVHLIRTRTAAEAIAAAAASIELDWIFLDYQLPDQTGLAVLKAFSEHMVTAPVIMISARDDVALAAEAIELGASGFVNKSCPQPIFEECMHAIERGEIYLSPELALEMETYRRTTLAAKSRIMDQMSARRMDILVMIAAGYSNAEMAAALSVSEATVKTHVSALISIFEADNRSHCVAEARKWGIIK